MFAIFNSLDFLALLFGSVIMDIEPFLILGFHLPYPLHGPIHSVIGALMITPLAYFAVLATRFFISLFKSSTKPKKSPKTVLISILIGEYSHLILDAFLYPEMNLAWPLHGGNPLLNIISLDWTYIICILCFFAGILILVLKKFFRRKV